MAKDQESLGLTLNEIAATFEHAASAASYPPVLTVDEAAQLLRVPKATIYDWRSRGLLNGCGRKVGKHLRFFRDRLLQKIFNQGLHE